MLSRRPDERGQSSIIIVGFAVLLLMTIAAVIDVTAAYLERQSLDSLADGAALHGADAGAEGGEVYSGGLDTAPLRLTAAQAKRGVTDYLRSVGAYREHPGLQVSVTVQGDEVRVRLSAPVDLPLTFPGAPASPRVSASGSGIVDPQ